MYATVAQLLARFEHADDPELTQLTGGGSGIYDETRLEAALDAASGEMDLYVGARYDLPVPGLTDAQAADLQRLCCDITRYRLWDVAASNEVRARYDDALRVLRDIRDGHIKLGAPPTGQVKATATSGTRRMTRDDLGGVL